MTLLSIVISTPARSAAPAILPTVRSLLNSPTINHIIQLNNDGQSRYDSLQMSYNQRNFHGFNNQVNFTWSKCFDYNSVNRGGVGDYPQLNNPYDPKDSYGLCDHDVRFNFNIGGVYTLPHIAALGKYLNGWQMSGILTAISGRPFTALLGGSDPSGQGMRGSSIRAAWDGTPIRYNTRDPNNYIQETYSDGTQADPCGNSDVGRPLSPSIYPLRGHRRQFQAQPTHRPGPRSARYVGHQEHANHGEAGHAVPLGGLQRPQSRQFLLLAQQHSGRAVGGFGQIKETSDVSAGNPVVAQGGPRNMNFAIKFVF